MTALENESGVPPNTEQAHACCGAHGSDRLERLLIRLSIVQILTPLTVLTSIVSDLDLFADWYFLKEGLEGESQRTSDAAWAFTAIGNVVYILLVVEFHCVSKVRTWCRGGEKLNALQHVPLGGQLMLSVVFEDIPQLIITFITSPTSVAGVLNLVTAVFPLLAKVAEAFATRNDLPMSAQLRMVEEDTEVVVHMMKQQRTAEEIALKAATLAGLVNQFRQNQSGQQTDSKLLAAIAFRIMQLEPGFLNGNLEDVRAKFNVEELNFRDADLKGEQALGIFELVVGSGNERSSPRMIRNRKWFRAQVLGFVFFQLSIHENIGWCTVASTTTDAFPFRIPPPNQRERVSVRSKFPFPGRGPRTRYVAMNYLVPPPV